MKQSWWHKTTSLDWTVIFWTTWLIFDCYVFGSWFLMFIVFVVYDIYMIAVKQEVIHGQR